MTVISGFLYNSLCSLSKPLLLDRLFIEETKIENEGLLFLVLHHLVIVVFVVVHRHC